VARRARRALRVELPTHLVGRLQLLTLYSDDGLREKEREETTEENDDRYTLIFDRNVKLFIHRTYFSISSLNVKDACAHTQSYIFSPFGNVFVDLLHSSFTRL